MKVVRNLKVIGITIKEQPQKVIRLFIGLIILLFVPFGVGAFEIGGPFIGMCWQASEFIMFGFFYSCYAGVFFTCSLPSNPYSFFNFDLRNTFTVIGPAFLYFRERNTNSLFIFLGLDFWNYFLFFVFWSIALTFILLYIYLQIQTKKLVKPKYAGIMFMASISSYLVFIITYQNAYESVQKYPIMAPICFVIGVIEFLMVRIRKSKPLKEDYSVSE